MEVKESKHKAVETISLKSHESKSLGAERFKEGASKTEQLGLNPKSWRSEQAFAVQKTAHGSAYTFEGWLSARDTKRSSADKSLQAEVNKEKRSPNDAGHLIAHSLGGPTVEQHGKEAARANLVLMDSRANRSHLNTAEKSIRNDLKAGKEIYCQVRVNESMGADGQMIVGSVTHRFFEKNKQGEPTPYKIAEVTTKIDQRSSQTLDQAVRKATDGRDGAVDFLSATRRGTVPGEH